MFTASDTEAAREYLEGYRGALRRRDLFRLELEAAPDFSNPAALERHRALCAYEILRAEQQMKDFERFTGQLEGMREGVRCTEFIYWRWVRGHTVERCAEDMFISRASAYRLQTKALRHVAALLGEKRSVLI